MIFRWKFGVPLIQGYLVFFSWRRLKVTYLPGLGAKLIFFFSGRRKKNSFFFLAQKKNRIILGEGPLTLSTRLQDFFSVCSWVFSVVILSNTAFPQFAYFFVAEKKNWKIFFFSGARKKKNTTFHLPTWSGGSFLIFFNLFQKKKKKRYPWSDTPKSF